MSQYISFERGRDDVTGPVLGPFEWVQVTYQDLRVAPDGEVIAQWVEEAKEWFIVDGEHADEFYSDFIVFSPSSFPNSNNDDHDCVKAKTTFDGEDGEGCSVEVRWNDGIRAWEPTGRLWDCRAGSWK